MIDLALLWHHHQPDYRDRETGVARLPWVRLHGIKDYYGLAALLRQFPGVTATFNLVPSLLLQLDAYARGEAREVQLELSRADPGSLDEAARVALVDFFFSCPTATMIEPRSRYRELLRKRNPDRLAAVEALRRFDERDLRDLQVLYNLVWFHPLVLEEREDLRALEEKGRDFTEEEKHLVLDAQREVIARVVPLHRELREAGRIELITSPLYHPILPLLMDGRSALEAMPDATLPARSDRWEEDARRQLRLGLDVFERFFGYRPAGLWPSEGSVSQALLPLIAEAGYRWLATDEGILARSLGRPVARDAGGAVSDPDLLYRMYALDAGGPPLAAVFRDRELSDGVGFRYSRMPPEQAVDDFMARLDAVKRKPGGPHLVSVILDGENAWEHYPGNGLAFLRALHRRIEDDPEIRTVTPGGLLEERPPERSIERLFAGSWIFESFGIWVGHDEDNRAWEMVARARDELLAAEREGRLPPADLEAARDALHAAEGSDWFWWFGPDHVTAHADEFDRLFRSHVRGIYRALGRPVPPSVDRPVIETRAARRHDRPTAFITPRIDGRVTHFFEWSGSALYAVTRDSGAMDLPATRLVEEARFGFDRETLYLRIDAAVPMVDVLAPDVAIRVIILQPRETLLTIVRPRGKDVEVRPTREGEPVSGEGIRAVAGRILELAVPFRVLGQEPEDEVSFVLEVHRSDRLVERAPRTGALAYRVPGDAFELEKLADLSRVGGETVSELRKDPILGRWVIVASERARRPSDLRPEEEDPPTTFCPFCEGNEDKTPPEITAVRAPGTSPNGPGWQVRVVPNKFPALAVEGDLEKRGVGMYDSMTGVGAHEVIIEGSDHLVSLTQMSDDDVASVLGVYRSRLLDLRQDRRLTTGMLFKNVGRAAGASLHHSHSQLIATPVVPKRVREEMDGAARWMRHRGRCIFCDMISEERADRSRLVLDAEDFVAFCPYASRFPFETWILPTAHASHYETLTDEARPVLARTLRRVLVKLEAALESPPYSYVVHSSPMSSDPQDHYHWHVEIIPRVTLVAGFEWGTGFYINPVSPEQAAGFLRDVDAS